MINEEKPYAYAYVREDGVGQLCWTKRDTSLFKDVLEGWKEIPLYTKEKNEVGDAEIKQMLNDIEYYQKRVEALEQPTQHNFCERCGKRASKDQYHIHTCTPPALKKNDT